MTGIPDHLFLLMKTIQTLIFVCCIQLAFAQTATIKVVRTDYPEQFRDFDKFIFSFNDLTFSATDTTAKNIRLNKNGFDQCYAILGKDTFLFLAKFKEGESYMIKSGCCCANFTITPDKDAKRGCVRFDNKASRDLWGIISEINTDTIKANSRSEYIFASESAMCLFKPAGIFIAETAYNNPKYDYYSTSEVNYDSLWTEQDKYILTSSSFLFLHGEKLTVEYIAGSNKMVFKFDGYLSDEEFKNRR
jgi:hypothetical protein